MNSQQFKKKATKYRNRKVKFIVQLEKMLTDPENRGIIDWNDEGTSIIVKGISQIKPILGRYFSHKNYHSFVRQLNYYGFYNAKLLSNAIGFSNQLFHRDQKDYARILKSAYVKKNKKQRGLFQTDKGIREKIETEDQPSIFSMPLSSSANCVKFYYVNLQRMIDD